MDKHNLLKIVNLRHELHSLAELSGKELKTKARLMNFLADNTSLRLVDMGKWFYVEYSCGMSCAPSIAFRADFDALPIDETINVAYASKTQGVSHKCGHDGHSAVLAGLALEIDRLGADKNIYFIFQHAEEIGAGGEECASFIEKKGISRVYAQHNRSGYPKSAVIYRYGMTQCASEGLELIFKGKAAHASQPETGINPCKALAELITYVYDLTDKSSFDDMVLCTVTHIEAGSYSFGIAAGESKVCLVLRANRQADMKVLEEMICARAKKLCIENSLDFKCEIYDRFPETRNNDKAVDDVRYAAQALNKQLIEMPEPWRASEDFGYYTQKCLGAMFYIGNGEDYPALHTELYDYNDDILETGVDMFYMLSAK